MKLFLDYTKERRFLILLNLVFVIVFCTTFYLYHLPILAVIYPTLICALLLILFLCVDFLNYKRRIQRLESAKKDLEQVLELLPEGKSNVESNYRAIIELMLRERLELEQFNHEKYQKMKEYYTLWVHQIKTPISSMKLTLQKEDSKLARKLGSEVFRIEQYVEMVLAYVRMTSETTDYVIREHSLDLLLKQSFRRFSSEFIDKRIQLIYAATDEVVLTDEKWFSFIIEQVLSNSLKYTQSGFVKVYVEEGQLCIEDSGIGIVREDLPRVFEHGYTGLSGRVDKRASGIGLYLCKVICDKLNHNIQIVSQQGVGTVVKLGVQQYILEVE